MDIQPYEPSARFDNTNGLYGNHFRFTIEALPDLTFFAQTVQLPSVTSPAVKRGSSFVGIQEVGDTLTYEGLTVTYLVDAKFKTYYSLYWWMKGYGFPHSYDEVEQFRRERKWRLPNPRPIARDIEKTTAVLYILQPDTEDALVEVRFSDVFPTALGQVGFSTTDGEPPQLTTTVTFACTEFDVFLME